MVKLYTPLLRAKVRQNNELRAKMKIRRKCTFVYEMLKRNIALREHVVMMKIDDLDELLLPPAMERRVDMPVEKPEDLKKVVLILKERPCTLRQARGYFNSDIGCLPQPFRAG